MIYDICRRLFVSLLYLRLRIPCAYRHEVQEWSCEPGTTALNADEEWKGFIGGINIGRHGVIGDAFEDGQVVTNAKPPGRDIVMVDAAALPFLQAMYSEELGRYLRPSDSGAASIAIYKYIGLINEFEYEDAPWAPSGDQGYDQDIKEACVHFADAHAHDYVKAVVIHVAGPDLRPISGHFKTREDAVKILSVTYYNIFSQFLHLPISRLRMPPISGGFYSKGASFSKDMPLLTWEAIAHAFNYFTDKQRDMLLRRDITLCIFMGTEYPLFREALNKYIADEAGTPPPYIAVDERVENAPPVHESNSNASSGRFIFLWCSCLVVSIALTLL
eukprot:TRINITY_DN32318_c0_g1_i1.p1 TRINITY_DN32318_c0_g1~~TRINITY_DN32318_c0_g1_i1.p1  ORF type:complete len:331 (+),score=15.62 TRINITY_DN32318_c0_g1_i1:30-1022(+)